MATCKSTGTSSCGSPTCTTNCCYIVELRNKGDKKDVSELENCFDALYGVMLLRLQHKPISNETAKAVADITKLLAMLSDYYKQDKAGELKFE